MGSHTTEAIHHRSQSEGGGNDKIHKENDTANAENSNPSEDEDVLILGTPFETYILRTKGTRSNMCTHTPVGETKDKSKSPQRNPANEESSKQKGWENLRRNFEKQFSYEDSGYSGGSTQNTTDQEVKKHVSQEEFDELRKQFEEKLKQFQSVGNNTGIGSPSDTNNSSRVGSNPPNPANMAAPQRRTKVPLPTYKGKTDPDTYMQEFNNVCLANQEDTDAIKLQFFPVTLKKKTLEWYLARIIFQIGHLWDLFFL